MKVAVIGSRGLIVNNLGIYLPTETTELVSGGAMGVGAGVRAHAARYGIKLTEFLPLYELYGHSALLRRNLRIIGYADLVLVFWDGADSRARFVIEQCGRLRVPVRVYHQRIYDPKG